MRHIGIIAAGASLVAGAAVPAWAQPAPVAPGGATPVAHPAPAALTAPTASAAPAGEPVCTIDDSRAVELSGLVTTASGYVAINDSNDVPGAMGIFFVDQACALTRVVHYPTTARDPEDLAVAPDGTLWVADIGDNFTLPADSRRRTVALWKLAPGASSPVIHRLAYPDGPHDAEALVLAGDGTPVIVTKEPAGAAGIYTPAGPLRPDSTTGVPLTRVGTFTPTLTGTSNPFGLLGQMMVTGGANAPDGRRVALRTYADAYEWDVPDGDVVKAITTGKPRITPLPGEPQGEALAYSRDGAGLLTVSDQSGPTRLLRYRATRPAPTGAASAAASAGATRAAASAGATRAAAGTSALDGAAGRLPFLAGAGLIGLGLVTLTLLAARRARRVDR
ncbi:hypothetical protein ACNTMW_05045 [Planosporangium sp. 12N6]|uniref:hypothetical protein n=1 Tax=Planosporangium spinosum TaxID=3402278 RepID=UPI003CF0122E